MSLAPNAKLVIYASVTKKQVLVFWPPDLGDLMLFKAVLTPNSARLQVCDILGSVALRKMQIRVSTRRLSRERFFVTTHSTTFYPFYFL
jgi:hypothetical protein